MSCVHINRVDNTHLRKRYLHCPMCMRTTEHVVRFEAWYDPGFMCCRCGDQWEGAELRERPFAPGWRDKNVRRFRRLWDTATHGPPPRLDEMLVGSVLPHGGDTG